MRPVPGEPGRRPRPTARCAERPPAGLARHRGGAAPTATAPHAALGSAATALGRRRLGLGVERVLDPARDRVDRLGVFADGVQRAVFAPAGDVGDRLAADVETDGAEHAVGDAVDEHLGLLAAVLLVAEAERVRELVHERADLAVRGSGRRRRSACAWGRTSRRARRRGARGSRRCSRARAARRCSGAIRCAVAVAGRSALRAARAGPAPCRAAARSSRRRRPARCGRRCASRRSPRRCSSRCLTVTGARIWIAVSPLRTQRLSARKARKPAT